MNKWLGIRIFTVLRILCEILFYSVLSHYYNPAQYEESPNYGIYHCMVVIVVRFITTIIVVIR